jgi:hypothetical protein
MVTFNSIYKVIKDGEVVVDNLEFVNEVLGVEIEKSKMDFYKAVAEALIQLRNNIHAFLTEDVDSYIVGVIGVYVYAYIQCEK